MSDDKNNDNVIIHTKDLQFVLDVLDANKEGAQANLLTCSTVLVNTIEVLDMFYDYIDRDMVDRVVQSLFDTLRDTLPNKLNEDEVVLVVAKFTSSMLSGLLSKKIEEMQNKIKKISRYDFTYG